MNGLMMTCLALVLAASAIVDLRSRRIPNHITFPAMALFLAWHAATGGLDGLLFALAGLGLGLGLMLAPYALGVMGAGDVKLMAVVGAALGARGVFWAFVLTSLAGGLYALVVLLRHRGGLGRVLRPLGHALMLARAHKGFVYAPPAPDQALPRLCYGVAIAAGSFSFMALARLGVGLFSGA